MSAPEPTGTGVAPESGAAQNAVARIAADAVVLDTVEHRPLSEHADVYQQVHAVLQGALAEIDTA